MKKIINNPELFVNEVLDGITMAYPDYIKALDKEKRVLVRANVIKNGKVAIVTGGGSGHLPVFLGYIGQGLLDGCTVGNVFASPSSSKMLETIKAVNQGAGVLCLFGHYSGDVLNFQMACEEAEFDGIKTAQVLVEDDVASATKEDKHKRRGVAGLVYAYKIAGAAANEGKSLNEVVAITNEALNNIGSMGVATSSCIVPNVGKETFSIKEDEIEIGMGIHGEPGIEVRKMISADDIADVLVNNISADIELKDGDEVSVMVNGLGATPLEELFIVYRRVASLLTKRNIKIYMPHVGEFATSMEMSVCSVSIFRLNEETKRLLSAPAISPFYTSINK